MSDINRRLAEGGIVLLDGGMGTELEARGVPMDDHAWSAVANLQQVEVVERVHEDFIRAGADVIITNTFAAGPVALEAAGLGGQLDEINRRAVEAAQRARDRAADRPVAIAGSMSVMGARASDLDGVDSDWLLERSRLQAEVLVDAGIDLIATEMIQSPDLHGPGVRAAAGSGLPVWLGLSAGPAGPDGTVPTWTYPDVELERVLRDLSGSGIAAVNVMHTELDDVDGALEVVLGHWDGPVGAYPHHGEYNAPTWVFKDLAPSVFTARARSWIDRGVRIVGGCCGIRPEHIRHLAEELADSGLRE